MEKDRIINVLRNQNVISENQSKQSFANGINFMAFIPDTLDVIQVSIPKDVKYIGCVNILFKDKTQLKIDSDRTETEDLQNVIEKTNDFLNVFGKLVNRYEVKAILPTWVTKTEYDKQYFIKENGTELEKLTNDLFRRVEEE